MIILFHQIPFSLHDLKARFAFSSSVISRRKRQFKSTFAMALSKVFSRGPLASQGIFFRTNSLKVFGIHTVPHSAEVIDNQSFWNWAFVKLIRKSVSRNILIDQMKTTISFCFRASESGPKPTGIGFNNFFKKPLFRTPMRFHPLFQAPEPFFFFCAHSCRYYEYMGNGRFI